METIRRGGMTRTRTSTLTLRVVWEDEEVDARGSSTRAEDGDPLGISAEVADVLVEPAQRLDLVQQAIVPFGGLITSAEEAWAHRFRGSKEKKKKSIEECKEDALITKGEMESFYSTAFVISLTLTT